MKTASLSLPLALVLAAPATAAQAVDFESAWIAQDVTTYPTGVRPAASIEADLDGDGLTDLATVSWESETQPRLALLFGTGKGGFDEPVLHVLDQPSRGLTAADLDADGDLDLAVSGTGKLFEGIFVEIWKNQGDGSFVQAGSYPAGQAPVGLDAADVDGDGDLDLAVALDAYITTKKQVALLFNTGSGAFSGPTTITTTGTSFQVAADDLNGDGAADLVVAGQVDDVTVLLNTGIGFAPGTKYAMSPAAYFDEWPTVELADVEGDGDLDVLYSSTFSGSSPGSGDTGIVGLRRNQGDGSFGALETIDLVEGFDGAVGFTLADVTGDGHDDLLAAIQWNDLWAVLPGDGTGAFGPAVPYRIGDGPIGVHAIDLDQDGDRDAAVLERGAMVVALVENLGGGQFPVLAAYDLVPASYNPASYSPSVSADFDGDDDLDVLVGFSANFLGPLGLSLARNQGDGTFARHELTSTAVFPQVVAAADVEGDGDVDVAYLDDDFVPRLRWRLNAGDGTFGPEQSTSAMACQLGTLVLADVDADGDADALAGGCYGFVGVSLFDSAAGAFQPMTNHLVGGNTEAIALGDLNGDGHVDLVTNSGVQNYPEISLGNGDGTFQAPFTQVGGFGAEAFAIADLDGDGILDLASHDETGESMTVLIGRGDGTMKPPDEYAAAYDDARSIAAVDADGDGDLDLIAPNPGGADVSLWRNRGDGEFDPMLRLGAGHPVTDLELGDFDGDGVIDAMALVEPNLMDWYYPGLVLMRGLAGDAWTDLGLGLAGTHGAPELTGLGLLAEGTPLSLHLVDALADAPGAFVIGNQELGLPLAGGTLVPSLTAVEPFVTDAAGSASVGAAFPPGFPAGASLWFQAWLLDPAAVQGFAASNALQATKP